MSLSSDKSHIIQTFSLCGTYSWKPRHSSLLILVLCRSTIKGEPKYYIREIKTAFVTGQTYPVHEVPGPHSRKITTTLKHRLQIIAFKLLRKSQGERLKISRLMKYFPDQNELQMRQRLKVCLGRFCACIWSDHVGRNLWSITDEGHIKGFGG